MSCAEPALSVGGLIPSGFSLALPVAFRLLELLFCVLEVPVVGLCCSNEVLDILGQPDTDIPVINL